MSEDIKPKDIFFSYDYNRRWAKKVYDSLCEEDFLELFDLRAFVKEYHGDVYAQYCKSIKEYQKKKEN